MSLKDSFPRPAGSLPMTCPSCGEDAPLMVYDDAIRAWGCDCCGRIYRLKHVRQTTGYQPNDRAQVGAEDGDFES